MKGSSIVLAAVILACVPLGAELIETDIAFEGTGCVECAESLKPRRARIRGVERVDLDLEHGRIHLELAPANKARLGPLRLRVTQDGTKILSMHVVVQGVAMEKDGAWIFAVSGPSETLELKPANSLELEAGSAYRVGGDIVESAGGELSLQAESAERVPQP